MKKLLPFFLVLSACGWFNPDRGYPTKEPVDAPPLIPVEEQPDLFYYAPLDVVDLNTAPKCEVEEVEEVIGPYKVETSLVKFVYGTIDFDEKIPVDRDELDQTDYVHVKEVWLEIAAGENFDFFSWAKINLENNLVAWGGPEQEDLYRMKLNVDGSVELKQYWVNREVRATGEIRGRVPASDTWVLGRLTFIRYFNCE